MKQSFGVKLPGLVPGYAKTLREVPQLVADLEALGFDDVMDGEHILFAPQMHHPGGAGNMVHGRTEQTSDRGDTVVMFAAIATQTTRIKLVSSVLLAAAHGFGVLARQAATLDVISNGRFVMGVGSGWFADEFAAMGIPPDERHQRLEETVRACRELWTPGLSSFSGKWIEFNDMISEPAPFTPGGVPIWWGGNALHRSTARRVATLGDGWLSREAAPYDEIAASIDSVKRACVDFGRDPETVGFRASLTSTEDWQATRSTEDLFEHAVRSGQRLAEAGVTHFTLPLNYYRLELDVLGEMLAVLRRA